MELVEAIGALQGQAWAALPAGLAARMTAFAPQDLYAALDADALRWGIGLRGTLHLVSAREHPSYARAAGTDGWARALKGTSAGMDALRRDLLGHCAQRRTSADLAAFADAWVDAHPDAIDPAEVAAQRALKWRPVYRWARVQRVPAGAFGARAPADHRAAPGAVASLEQATEAIARRHLGAFGPAAAEDVAQWMGHRPKAIRELLEELALPTFADDAGRTLFDLPDAPRPDPDTPAPPRFLGAFDSCLLAYAPRHRGRIVAPALIDRVYNRVNLQVRPTFLLDGIVAGTWSLEARKRTVTLTLDGGPKRIPRALRDEGERLLAILYPGVPPRIVR